MHNATAHHLLTDACPIPEQRSSPSSQLLPVYIQGMMISDMGYSYGQFSLTVLLILSHGFLCHSSLAKYEKLKSPLLTVSTTEQWTKHQCAINIILLLNTKHSTSSATKKRINSLPAKKRQYGTLRHDWVLHLLFSVSVSSMQTPPLIPYSPLVPVFINLHSHVWLALLPKWSHTSLVVVFLMWLCRCCLWCMILHTGKMTFSKSTSNTCEGWLSLAQLLHQLIQPTFTVWSAAVISCFWHYVQQFLITFSIFPPPLSQPNLHPGPSEEPDHLPVALTPSLCQVNEQKF